MTDLGQPVRDPDPESRAKPDVKKQQNVFLRFKIFDFNQDKFLFSAGPGSGHAPSPHPTGRTQTERTLT